MNQTDAQEIANCVAKYLQMAHKIWGYQLRDWKTPTLSFDLRGTAAGRAWLQRNHIQINEILFKENKEDFFKRTIPHEVAHLVAFRVFCEKGHGKDWKFVMTRFGCDPSRCHSYDVSNSKISKTVKRYIYSCSCTPEAKLTKGFHEKMNGRGKCIKCHSPALFTGKIILTKT